MNNLSEYRDFFHMPSFYTVAEIVRLCDYRQFMRNFSI